MRLSSDNLAVNVQIVTSQPTIVIAVHSSRPQAVAACLATNATAADEDDKPKTTKKTIY